MYRRIVYIIIFILIGTIAIFMWESTKKKKANNTVLQLQPPCTRKTSVKRETFLKKESVSKKVGAPESIISAKLQVFPHGAVSVRAKDASSFALDNIKKLPAKPLKEHESLHRDNSKLVRSVVEQKESFASEKVSSVDSPISNTKKAAEATLRADIRKEKEDISRMSGSAGRRREPTNSLEDQVDEESSSLNEAGEEQHTNDDEDEDKFVFEAEDALSLTPYFVIGQDESASNSKFISAPESHHSMLWNEGGKAEYSFEVRKAGRYKVYGRVIAPTAGSDSFYISIDNRPQYTWDLPENPDWVWQVVTKVGTDDRNDLTFELEAGKHILKIGNREDGTMLDVLVIQRLSN